VETKLTEKVNGRKKSMQSLGGAGEITGRDRPRQRRGRRK
jgi:hypothetical protein